MWNVFTSILGQVTVFAASFFPKSKTVKQSIQMNSTPFTLVTMKSQWPFTVGFASTMYLYGKAYIFERPIDADSLENALKLRVPKNSSASMIPSGTGHLYISGSGYVTYGYETGVITKVITEQPISIDLNRLLSLVHFQSGNDDLINIWSGQNKYKGPGTYAIQTYLRGDSGFTLNISGKNDTFRMQTYADSLVADNKIVFAITGSSSSITEVTISESNLLQTVVNPADFILQNIDPDPQNPKLFQFSDIVFNGLIWVGLQGFVGFNANRPGIAYSYDAVTWNFAKGNTFDTIEGNVVPAPTQGYRVAWNGQYFLAVGNPSNFGLGFQAGNLSPNGSIVKSFDGITWTTVPGGFRYAGTDLSWNGSIWLICGSDYDRASARQKSVYTYNGTTLTDISSNFPSMDAISVDWDTVNNKWILLGVDNSQSLDPGAYTKNQLGSGNYNKNVYTISSALTVLSIDNTNYNTYKNIKCVRVGKNTLNQSYYIMTTDSYLSNSAQIYYSTDLVTWTAKLSGQDITKFMTLVYLKSNTGYYWLAMGSNLSSQQTRLYISKDHTTWSLLDVNTLNTNYGTILICAASTRYNDDLWTLPIQSPLYIPGKILLNSSPVYLDYGFQSPQSFISNLSKALTNAFGTLITVNLETFDDENPDMIHISKLRWTFSTSTSTTNVNYVTFLNWDLSPLSPEVAATYGLYTFSNNQSTIQNSYNLVANSFTSPSPIILHQPITWTFKKLGIPGAADSDGSVKLIIDNDAIVLGPGTHEFFAPTHDIKLFGTFVGSTQFSTVSAVFNISTTTAPYDSNVNTIHSAYISIIQSDTEIDLTQFADTDDLEWTNSSSTSIEATFTSPFVINDNNIDFLIQFDAIDSDEVYLGTFSFMTTYYSSLKYTERMSPLFAVINAAGPSAVKIQSIGAGGGSFSSQFKGGESIGIEQTLQDTNLINSFFATVGHRGRKVDANGCSGGTNSRVTINNVVICDVGSGGGASNGSNGGSATFAGPGLPGSSLTAAENGIQGSDKFGFLESKPDIYYNLRPGGRGGRGANVEYGLITETIIAGTGTQSNQVVNVFGAGGAGNTAYLEDGFVLSTTLLPEESSRCMPTSILQELDEVNVDILDTVITTIAKNPVYVKSNLVSTNVSQLNVGIPSVQDYAVRSFVGLGPIDDYLPNSMAPNCFPIIDTTGTTPQLILNKLEIYDDGQVIYDDLKDYLGTAFYCPGFQTYVTDVAFKNSERYNSIVLSFQDSLPNSYGPFYWQIPAPFLNGTVIHCDGLEDITQIKYENETLLEKIYDGINHFYISTTVGPSGPGPLYASKTLPGSNDYAKDLWPCDGLFIDIYTRPTNGPKSIRLGHSQEFNYTGEEETFQVPIWTTSVKITCYGAAASSMTAYEGGPGSLVTSTFQNLAGSLLTLSVGLGGRRPIGNFCGGLLDSVYTLGGGCSAVKVNTTFILVAAGGGSGSFYKKGLSEFDKKISLFDGIYGNSTTSQGQNSSDLGNSGAGGSGIRGGTAGNNGFSGGGGISFVPQNGKLQIGFKGSKDGLAAINGKIIIELF